MDAAIAFAIKKHEGQVRKFSGLPYVVHPINVARRVAQLGGTNAQIVAAYLHDVLEDTDATEDELRTEFGNEVTDLVLEVTNDKVMMEKMGKTDYLVAKTAEMSPEAYMIKVLDREDNVRDLDKASPEFAVKYAQSTASIFIHRVGWSLHAAKCWHIHDSIWEKIEPYIKK